jgi:uncharacterized protein (TIGR02001 family)
MIVKRTRQIFLGALGLAAACAWNSPAMAIDGLTANIGLATDYVFRGVTQSAKDPAIQGGLDYAFGDSRFMIGTWASNIDFGDDSPMEVDLYGNYNFMLGQFGASVGVYGYLYPSSGNAGPYDFWELDASLSHDFGAFAWSAKGFWGPSLPESFLTIQNGYHPDWEYFLTTGISIPVVDWLAVSGNAGYEGYSGGKPAGTPDDSYVVWDIGVTLTYRFFSLDLRYIDSDTHTLASYTGDLFATGPFYVATAMVKF